MYFCKFKFKIISKIYYTYIVLVHIESYTSNNSKYYQSLRHFFISYTNKSDFSIDLTRSMKNY